MKTNQEQVSKYPQQRGSALLYVLIAVALLAALSFTLGRQSRDSGDSSNLDEEKAELYATQMIATAAQVKSAIDQMLFSGADVAELDFQPPTHDDFEAGDVSDWIYKVYHPQGGGITLPRLAPEAIGGDGTDPAPGWYMGRFNNVDWSPLAAGNTAGDAGGEAPYEDVFLTAYQIEEQVCALINEKVNGSPAIPVMTDTIPNTMIDASLHSAGSNVELTTGSGNICVACENVASLCVEDSDGNFGFYTVIAEQ